MPIPSRCIVVFVEVDRANHVENPIQAVFCSLICVTSFIEPDVPRDQLDSLGSSTRNCVTLPLCVSRIQRRVCDMKECGSRGSFESRRLFD